MQETLAWMQSSYRQCLSGVAGAIGDKVILSGCVVANNQVSNGWVSIGGELLPFIGGAYQAGDEVVVVETPQPAVTFQDNSSQVVYFERSARIGGPGGFPFTDLKPLNWGVPPGSIIMWSGSIASIPAGFALCDGTGGTPNLSGQFIVGYNAADTDYDAIGKSGGAKEVTLTVPQIPPHNHLIRTHNKGGGDGNTHMGLQSLGVQKFTENTGGGQPHENRPPYYTLAYIIKK